MSYESRPPSASLPSGLFVPLLLAMGFLNFNITPLYAQPTSTNSISLQAKLDGVTGPAANLTVKFFDALTGGSQVGATVTLSDVPVQDGIVSVPVSPIVATIFNGQLVCSTPYDTRVAGAISGAGGLSVGVVMGKDNPDPLIKGDHPVAMSGRVYVWCDATLAAIKPGDRLTTSNSPGLAMKAVDPAKWDGAVIGKAMTELNEGKGLVLVLVNLQ